MRFLPGWAPDDAPNGENDALGCRRHRSQQECRQGFRLENLIHCTHTTGHHHGPRCGHTTASGRRCRPCRPLPSRALDIAAGTPRPRKATHPAIPAPAPPRPLPLSCTSGPGRPRARKPPCPRRGLAHRRVARWSSLPVRSPTDPGMGTPDPRSPVPETKMKIRCFHNITLSFPLISFFLKTM